jgi:hypothetical protein
MSRVLIPRPLSWDCMQKGVVLVKLERAEVMRRVRTKSEVANSASDERSHEA